MDNFHYFSTEEHETMDTTQMWKILSKYKENSAIKMVKMTFVRNG